jgi:hypothetical protein
MFQGLLGAYGLNPAGHSTAFCRTGVLVGPEFTVLVATGVAETVREKLKLGVEVKVLLCVGGTGVRVAEAVKLKLAVDVLVALGGMDVSVAVSVGTAGVGVQVLVQLGVSVGVGVAGCGITWIASTMALSTEAGPNWIVINPPLGWMFWNTSSRALFAPPAAAKISIFVKTVAPLMEALKTLFPAAFQ